MLYKIVFEEDPTCMSREVMEVIVDIAYWFVSPSGTFIRFFGREKPLHILPWYAIDKLIMQEVSYHLATGFLVALHKKKKAPWPTLHLKIRLYEIKNLKVIYVEAKEIMRFEFGTKDFNLFHSHNICKDHCTRVYFLWISGAFHWPDDDPWRYCYNASRLNEPVSLARTSQASPQTAVAPKATITERNNLVQ